jgi:N-acetylmuramoyl-L-alanine amidase
MKKVLVLSLLFVLFVHYSEAAKQTAVKGLRHASYKSYTRVVVDIDGPLEYSHNRLYNPNRLYFDLKNCRLSAIAKSSLKARDNILGSVRMAQFDKETVRVVFDLKNSKNFYAFLLENPYRLVIDVYAIKDSVAAKAGKKEKKVSIDKAVPEIKTIVIDPGHGGKDPGAVGPKGLREKDIVLAVSKKLGKILREKHGVNVVYTRKRDTFVPLNERTEIANAKGADLFISIHTNASRKKSARGIETYFLNWTNNREALRVAARENKISFNKMQKVQDELNLILNDLARNNKRQESMRLAYSVQSSMVNLLKKDYRSVKNLGVKYALFYVLVGAEMPSILVEISFISNREEERRLAKDSFKEMIANALAKGINTYISQSALIVQRDSAIP